MIVKTLLNSESECFLKDHVTEDWGNDAELNVKMCSNRNQLFLVKSFHNITAFCIK